MDRASAWTGDGVSGRTTTFVSPQKRGDCQKQPEGTRRLAPVVDLVFAAEGVRCRLENSLDWAEHC
jgi:hypothetical protein